MNKFECKSVRLCRFLYGLGFDKESQFNKDGTEYWLFEKSDDLQESLDFFFYMRKKRQELMNYGKSNIYTRKGTTNIE